MRLFRLSDHGTWSSLFAAVAAELALATAPA
jgi:hypothetical protein